MIKPFVNGLRLVCLKSCSKLNQTIENKKHSLITSNLSVHMCLHFVTAVTQAILNVNEVQTLARKMFFSKMRKD